MGKPRPNAQDVLDDLERDGLVRVGGMRNGKKVYELTEQGLLEWLAAPNPDCGI